MSKGNRLPGLAEMLGSRAAFSGVLQRSAYGMT
jgi:hypothetical protein